MELVWDCQDCHGILRGCYRGAVWSFVRAVVIYVVGMRFDVKAMGSLSDVGALLRSPIRSQISLYGETFESHACHMGSSSDLARVLRGAMRQPSILRDCHGILSGCCGAAM